MNQFAYHEGRIVIDFGLVEGEGMILNTFVECPEVEDELPHRIMVEGALMMARDSLDAIYSSDD